MLDRVQHLLVRTRLEAVLCGLRQDQQGGRPPSVEDDARHDCWRSAPGTTAPKGSPHRKPWSECCGWDSSLNFRDPCQRQPGRGRSHTSMRQEPLGWRRRTQNDSRHQPGGEQRTLTTSVFSGRSRRTARPHHRRSKPSALSRVGEHFGRADHFANLRPICSHLQGQAIQQLLTAVTCAYSPTRGHRVLSTAAQNRGALLVKQGAPPALTCGNARPQVRAYVVGPRSVQLNAAQRRSAHPTAPNPLPRSPPHMDPHGQPGQYA
jgi:hypothetical protein